MPRHAVAVALALLALAAAGQAQTPKMPRQPGRPNSPPSPALPPPIVIPPFPASPPIYLPPPIVIPPFVPPSLPPLDPPPMVPDRPALGTSFGPVTNEGTCTGCNKAVHWTGTSLPKRCPHCGVRFSHVENEDGSSSRIPGGGAFGDWSPAGMRGPIKLLGLVVVLVIVAVGGVAKVASGGGSSRPKRSKRPKAKRPRPIEEDDDDEPPRRRARPRADESIPMATLADDPGYEVVGDAPPDAPEPRRAKAKLIPPDGGPR